MKTIRKLKFRRLGDDEIIGGILIFTTFYLLAMTIIFSNALIFFIWWVGFALISKMMRIPHYEEYEIKKKIK